MTTADAELFGSSGSSAPTGRFNAGTADRINNLQLGVELLDGARIAPGDTWSFNEFVGAAGRPSAACSAPVIMDGKYEEESAAAFQVSDDRLQRRLGGGYQDRRAPRARLYISRYPDGRDANVNYPDVDLKLVNDTPRWIVIKASYDESAFPSACSGPGRAPRRERRRRAQGDRAAEDRA